MSLRRFRQLTPRQYEILLLVLEGLPNKAIAGKLNIRLGTVKHHRKAIMEKMKIDNIPQLVRLAVEAEII
jgi:DNA-binding NarL/FixJ family response regulator